jgi:macrodomain Ter protein organizer (MatP/YcbG family)
MAKETTDRTTLDLFSASKQRGRPKTSLLSREQQLRANKKNQLRRDKQKGLKRVEIKLELDIYDKANELAEDAGLSRSEFLAKLITDSIK